MMVILSCKFWGCVWELEKALEGESTSSIGWVGLPGWHCSPQPQSETQTEQRGTQSEEVEFCFPEEIREDFQNKGRGWKRMCVPLWKIAGNRWVCHKSPKNGVKRVGLENSLLRPMVRKLRCRGLDSVWDGPTGAGCHGLPLAQAHRVPSIRCASLPGRPL